MKRIKLIILSWLMLFITIVLGSPLIGNQVAAAQPAAKKEKVHISFAAGRPGDMWYVLSHALSTFINKESIWVTADVVATAGVTDNTRLIMGDKKLRSNHINVTMLPGATVWGLGEYMPLQIGMLVLLNEAFVTLDPNIKTLSDFSGKAIALPRDVPMGYTFIFRNILDLGGAKDYSIMFGGIGARLTALRDGAAKAGVLPFDFYYPNQFALSASLMELGARGTLYYPNQGNIEKNKKLVSEACIKDPFVGSSALPPLGMVAPAKSLGPTQTEALVYVSTPVYWSAGKEMPEDVVYEITRILYKAAENGDFIPYHAMGKGITTDFLPMSFWKDPNERKAMFHPGAVKFYEEKKVVFKTFLD